MKSSYYVSFEVNLETKNRFESIDYIVNVLIGFPYPIVCVGDLEDMYWDTSKDVDLWTYLKNKAKEIE